MESVIRQTVLPARWVIVNDGSTDETGDIVARYLPKYSWIELVNLPVRRGRNFAAKVNAFNAGLERVKDIPYEILGNLDADISLDEDHLEFLLTKLSQEPRLGVAGTTFREDGGYNSEKHSFEGKCHVSGQCQIFRRECFEEIGGYFANEAGGIDWIAVTTARMIGWKTRSYREKPFIHNRHLGTAGQSVLAAFFSYGEKDYYLGGSPIWQFFRVIYRIAQRPYVVDGLALGLGYGWAMVRRIRRPISKELMQFHRHEQMRKLTAIVKSVLAFRRIDKFDLLPD